MDQLFDTLARILATPKSRRKALGLAGGALATAVAAALGVQTVHAQPPQGPNTDCTPQQTKGGSKTCKANGGGTCCPPGTCCANTGRAGARCCNKGQCVCANGTCAASNGGKCPGGCTACNG